MPLSSRFLQSASRLGLVRSQLPVLSQLVSLARLGTPLEGKEVSGGLILLEDRQAKAEETVLQLLEQGFEEGRDLNQITIDIKQRYGVR
jgi:hypothetical protein